MSSRGNASRIAAPPPLPHAELTPPAIPQIQAPPAADPTAQIRSLPPPRRSRGAFVVGLVGAVALAAVLLALRRKHAVPPATTLPVAPVAAAPVAPTVTPLPPPEITAPAPTERGAPHEAAPEHRPWSAHEQAGHAAPLRERPAARKKHARAGEGKPSTGPGRVAAHAAYARGNALLFSGDAGGAVDAYQEAVRLAPADPSGYRGLGLAYEKEGKVKDAIAALVSYLKLSRHAHDREVVARRLYRLTHPHDE